MKTLVDVFVKEKEPENLYLLFLEDYQKDSTYPGLVYMPDEDIFLKVVDGKAYQLKSELVSLSLGEKNVETIKNKIKMNKVITETGQEVLFPDDSFLSEL